ncbi:MAG TPA: hypothetical protein VN514_04405 [Ignavibacteria bacterium]|nr:hypothetical protein [Ignavibacteria bacterium]
MEKIRQHIVDTYEKRFKEIPSRVEELKRGVSEKLILRIISPGKQVIGIYNRNLKENRAFLEFTKAFSSVNLKIPEILHIEKGYELYFISNAGRNTLFDYIRTGPRREYLLRLYRMALRDLIDFQFYGRDLINLRYCYETKYFDKSQILFDIKRFYKYFVTKFLNAEFDISERKISEIISPKILGRNNFFMYRDFQPRNIVKNRQNLYYLDYQSGRIGPPQYDLASFLYSGSIDVTPSERKELVHYYYLKSNKKLHDNDEKFVDGFEYFALLRLMQVLGSYCYSGFERGMYETMSKIPKAVKNLNTIVVQESELNRLIGFVNESYLTRISKRR